MQLDKYISQLLYVHDCVIVPDLGGIVGNYKPAYIHPTKHTFTPPTKALRFNPSLVDNDGLLVNHIAKEKNLSYEKSVEQVSSAVNKLQTELDQQKEVLIQHVGTLKKNESGTLEFKPDTRTNYLLDSYGFTVFNSLPIQREQIEERVVRKIKKIAAEPTKTKVRRFTSWKAAAVITLVAACTFLFVWQFDQIQNFTQASLNPFNSLVDSIEKDNNEATDTESDPNSDNAPNLVKESDVVSNESSETAYSSNEIASVETTANRDNEIETTTGVTNNDETDEELKVSSEPSSSLSIDENENYIFSTEASSNKYFIVGGCFGIEKNARKLVNRLSASGYDSRIVGKTKGLHMVCYRAFSKRKDAVNALRSIQASGKSGWIYKRK